MEAVVKLYVCCHRKFYVPKHELLFPIWTGASLGGEDCPGMLRDDTGCHISAKNPDYCELTAQYWAWKNDEADYYGFFHYRRYLSFAAGATAKREPPYIVERYPSAGVLERHGYAPEHMRALIGRFDLIVPCAEEMYLPVEAYYARSRGHDAGDLVRMEQILLGQYPEFAAAARAYLQDGKNYFGNLYIMKKELFRRYCAWLFPLLAEFDAWKAASPGRLRLPRTDGYLAERLFGIYYTWLRQSGCRCAELPKIQFEGMLGGGVPYAVKKGMAAVFPPGSRRRGLVRRVLPGG